MAEAATGTQSATGSGEDEQSATGGITAELVEKIADKVIEKLLLELKYEYERYRMISRRLVGR